MNRTWHAITAEFNTIYNGNLALEEGKKEMQTRYTENFWDILPVEPMHIDEFGFGISQEDASYFQTAETKAIKAIQKHSMLIEGWERNPQVDEAYMLLGKARYYDQRFVPALEAFNFILQRYPLSNNINGARIWRGKTQIRLNQEQLVVDNLKDILEEKSLDSQERADAASSLGQAYINLRQLDSALVSIKEAADLTTNNEEKGRYLFIAGQLHNELGERTAANEIFAELLNLHRKIPRKYWIHAQLLMLSNLAMDVQHHQSVLNRLSELATERENRSFLDRIYFEMASFYQDLDSLAPALRYYKRSLYENSSDTVLLSLTYEHMGNIYLQEKIYPLAGSYFDSTLTHLSVNSREFRQIQRKRNNLEDVIHYENVLKVTDSVLYLAGLSKEDQVEFFTSYTNELEETALEAEELSGAVDNFSEEMLDFQSVSSGAASFYFYNSNSVARGMEEFVRVWGPVPPVDNWRTTTVVEELNGNDAEQGILEETVDNNPLFDPQTYLEQIPVDQAVLDSLENRRDYANYQLGLIYRDQFEELELAASHLERLLEQGPEERLLVPAKYNLYRIYEKLQEHSRSRALKHDILKQHPSSRYALILEDPQKARNVQPSDEQIYEKLNELFEAQEFEEVIIGAEDFTSQRYGDPNVPVYRMLRAKALGRLLGLEAYRKALNEVALDYPQSEEGKKAALLLSETLPRLEEESFEPESSSDAYKLVFRFNKADMAVAKAIEKDLDSVIHECGLIQYDTSVDVYNPEEIFLTVHGFKEKSAAESFRGRILNLKETLNIENYFYISASNYRIVQIHKNLETYLN